MFTAREIKYIINNSEAKFIITSEDSLAKVLSIRGEMPTVQKIFVVGKGGQPDVIPYHKLYEGPTQEVQGLDVDPESISMVFYTSGTTGNPKGAMLTHNGLITNAEVMVETLGFTESDRSLCVLPFFHLFATMFGLLQMMCAGGSTVIVEGKFDEEIACRLIEKHKVTVLLGVPTIFIYLINYPGRRKYDLSSLRMGVTGSGPVPVTLKAQFEKDVGIVVVEGYGLTEAGPIVCIERPGGERRLGSCGLTLKGLETRVVDQNGKDVPPGEIGELIVKGYPYIMKGYWKLPKETSETLRDGWLYTGDLVKKDKDGYVYVVDRIKDMIVRGGYNIYPKEIEMVLYSHPSVLEAAVVGAFDEVLGEVPKAHIVLKPGENISKEEMDKYCRENLAAYKVPREIVFVDELPKTGSGKIRKVEIREREKTKRD
jgi:long-chain acyl-CoA synthetase